MGNREERQEAGKKDRGKEGKGRKRNGEKNGETTWICIIDVNTLIKKSSVSSSIYERNYKPSVWLYLHEAAPAISPPRIRALLKPLISPSRF